MNLQIDSVAINELFESLFEHLDLTKNEDGTLYLDIVSAASYAAFHRAIRWAYDSINTYTDEEFMAIAQMMSAQVNDSI